MADMSIPEAMTLRELGQRADEAKLGFARAGLWVGEHATELPAMLDVSIHKANFGNGTQQLETALKSVIDRHIEELISEAMAVLEVQATDARNALKVAFDSDIDPTAAPQTRRRSVAAPARTSA